MILSVPLLESNERRSSEISRLRKYKTIERATYVNYFRAGQCTDHVCTCLVKEADKTDDGR